MSISLQCRTDWQQRQRGSATVHDLGRTRFTFILTPRLQNEACQLHRVSGRITDTALPNLLVSYRPTHNVYTVSQKSVLEICDCILKTNHQILLIFGTNIPNTTCHWMTIQLLCAPSVCFCTTWRKHNQWNITFLSNAIWLL